MSNTFDWVEIRTRDIARAGDFYENVFSWRVVDRETADGSDYWIVDTGDEPRVENLRRAGIWLTPEGRGVGVVVYVVVEDIDAVLARVGEFGGESLGPKVGEGRAFKAYFRDPDGNLFGLWEEGSSE